MTSSNSSTYGLHSVACFYEVRPQLGLASAFITMAHLSLGYVMYQKNVYVSARGKILISLAFSDLLVPFIALPAGYIGVNINIRTKRCRDLQYASDFAGNLYIGSTSGNISLLAIERYMQCLHPYTLSYLFDGGIKWVIAFSWVLYTLFAGLPLLEELKYMDNLFYQFRVSGVLVYVPFIFLTGAILVYTQLSLYILGRRKIVRDVQLAKSMRLGDDTQLRLRSRRIKLAATASVLAVVYIACYMPIGILSIYRLTNCRLSCSEIQKPVATLCIVNAISDPFVYGFTIPEVKDFIKRKLRKVTTKNQGSVGTVSSD